MKAFNKGNVGHQFKEKDNSFPKCTIVKDESDHYKKEHAQPCEEIYYERGSGNFFHERFLIGVQTPLKVTLFLEKHQESKDSNFPILH